MKDRYMIMLHYLVLLFINLIDLACDIQCSLVEALRSQINLHYREDQFTESANVSIFTGTWNVNAKKLDGELNDWLLNEQGGMSFSVIR
jgi:hypothetical protein